MTNRVIVHSHQILNDSGIVIRHCPPTPITKLAKVPPFLCSKVLSATLPEGMRSILPRINLDVKQIVTEEVEESISRLK